LDGAALKSPLLVNGQLEMYGDAANFERQISSPWQTEVWAFNENM